MIRSREETPNTPFMSFMRESRHLRQKQKARTSSSLKFPARRQTKGRKHYLIVVDVCISSDDNSLLNPSFGDASFNSLEGKQKDLGL